MDIVRKSRPERDKESSAAVPDFVRKYISWGAGPRAGQAMVMAGKARAALAGRFFVSRESAPAPRTPVLRDAVTKTKPPKTAIATTAIAMMREVLMM